MWAWRVTPVRPGITDDSGSPDALMADCTAGISSRPAPARYEAKNAARAHSIALRMAVEAVAPI